MKWTKKVYAYSKNMLQKMIIPLYVKCLKMMFRVLWKRSFLSLLGAGVLLWFISMSGVHQHLLSLSFTRHYIHWGPNAPLQPLITQIEKGLTPDVLPVNEFHYEYIFTNKHKCEINDPNGSLRLLILVKSALSNFYARDVIRQTWGNEQRFSDVTIRTIFLVGASHDSSHLQTRLRKENNAYKDIIQADFIDNYFNNTIKTIMGHHWAFHFCDKVKYFFFVDDDYYLSTRNVLRFLKDPKNYPKYLHSYIIDSSPGSHENIFAGYVFPSSRPKRWKLSKWYVSLEEYPYSHYPPYVTAGAYLLPRRSLKMLYYAGLYTKFFRFDDIFMGMCALKANLNLLHHPEFHYYKYAYSIEGYKYVIASHGYSDPDEMHRVWEEQRSVGSA